MDSSLQFCSVLLFGRGRMNGPLKCLSFRYVACCNWQDKRIILLPVLVTFLVRRRRREMYSGHSRLCVHVSVCVCLSSRHVHTTPRTRV